MELQALTVNRLEVRTARRFASPPACVPPDSESTAVWLLLLASLNSCRNPWIYMLFSGPLLLNTTSAAVTETLLTQ